MLVSGSRSSFGSSARQKDRLPHAPSLTGRLAWQRSLQGRGGAVDRGFLRPVVSKSGSAADRALKSDKCVQLQRTCEGALLLRRRTGRGMEAHSTGLI